MIQALRLPTEVPTNDFRTYLEQSLRNPFALDLKDCTLIEVIRACAKAKAKIRPKYPKTLSALIYNLKALQAEYGVTLYPVQVTDVFWGYFVSFMQDRGLRASSIANLCTRLRSVLNWAVKYNATVSPTYTDIIIPTTRNVGVALTADEISRVSYFDIERFYADRRKDFRKTMDDVRNLFVLSCNLGQRYSDMIRIEPSCFERNIFRIVQQKTGNRAVVNIDKLAIEPKTTYRILEKYGYYAPYTHSIGNYNYYLHQLLRDVGLDDPIRIEEKRGGKIVTEVIPKWKAAASHCGRRSFVTVNIVRGHSVHEIRKATAHSDARCFDKYICDGDD